jgi:hypothetical protein
MEIFNTIILSILAFGLIILMYFQFRQKPGDNGEKITVLSERLREMMEQNKELRQIMDNKLSETNKINQEQFGKTFTCNRKR